MRGYNKLLIECLDNSGSYSGVYDIEEDYKPTLISLFKYGILTYKDFDNNRYFLGKIKFNKKENTIEVYFSND